MPGKDRLEDMLQDGWKIVGTYGDTSVMLEKGESRRLMDRAVKHTMPDELEDMLQNGWKIVGTFGYTSLVLAKGKFRRLIDKTGKYAMKEYGEGGWRW